MSKTKLLLDTSSVYVDYLALRRPVFFYFPDLNAYRQTRKFLLEPVEEWLAGPLCQSAQALLKALDDFVNGKDHYANQRKKMADILNPQIQVEAAGKVFALLEQ